MDAGEIIALIGALGLGGILTTGAKAAVERLTGRADREQNAWVQRDHEATKRRILEESLHQHRTAWLEAGLPFDELPPWPRMPDRPR